MRRRRSSEQIQELVEAYRTSGMTQSAYAQQVGIALSTLGRYLRRDSGGQRLVRVKLASAAEPERGFALVLSNGRRIESRWCFDEEELTRLIRIAEAV